MHCPLSVDSRHLQHAGAAIGGTLFAVLSSLNHVGALGFGASMDRPLRHVPETIGPRHALIPLAIVTLTVITLDVTAMLPSPLYGIHLPVVTQMALIIAFIGAQWLAAARRASKPCGHAMDGSLRDPRLQRVLRWCRNPMVLDWGQVLTQGYTFAFFAMILCWDRARYSSLPTLRPGRVVVSCFVLCRWRCPAFGCRRCPDLGFAR